MKNLKTMIFAACTLAGAMTSCTAEMDDWGVDAAYDRLFAITSIDIEPSMTSAVVTFSGNAEAEQYQIQLSKDSLYDSMESEPADLKVYTVEKSPATIDGLMGDTYYFIRVRAISSTKKASHWIYPVSSTGKRSFHTEAEQIFNEITDNDRQQDAITLTWTPGAEVTHIMVTEPEVEPVRVDLTDAEKVAGKKVMTDLKPSTPYTFTIYNNEAKRGVVAASTTAAAPKGDYTYYMKDEDNVINTQFLADIAAAAKAASGDAVSYSATIVLAGGSTVDMYGVNESGEATNLVIPDGLSVTFFGAAGTVPVIKMSQQINFKGSHAFIKFQNLVIDGGDSGYFVNQSNAGSVQDFVVEDCVIKNFKTSWFRMQGTDAKNVTNLVVKNSTFDNLCNGYSFIHVDAGSGAGVINDISIDGCTFSNIAPTGKMFIYSKNTPMSGAVKIANSTFYRVIGNGNYFIDYGAADYGPAGGITIENCLFGKGADEVTNKNIRSSATPVILGSYHTSDWFKNLKTDALEKSSAEVFTDAENGDFSLKIDMRVGDPRWYKNVE